MRGRHKKVARAAQKAADKAAKLKVSRKTKAQLEEDIRVLQAQLATAQTQASQPRFVELTPLSTPFLPQATQLQGNLPVWALFIPPPPSQLQPIPPLQFYSIAPPSSQPQPNRWGSGQQWLGPGLGPEPGPGQQSDF